MKKKILSLIFFGIAGILFAQEKEKKAFSLSPFFTMGTAITLNTDSSLNGAPSPASFFIGGGVIWPTQTLFSFQPRLGFWTNYYLWDGEKALPAEIENRTALALNFMLDLPACATFRFEKWQLETGLGLGILSRLSILSPGVSENDSGASGSAASDKEKIQSYFWSSARFLYPEIFFAVEYRVTEKIAAGLEARYYLPAGSLASGTGFDQSIFMFAAKVSF